MIVELTDEEIFEFLMTSDLNENHRPDDYKYLIFKFRNFYKILHGKHQLYKTNNESLAKNLQSVIDNLTLELEKERINTQHLRSDIQSISQPRKLSWKERFTGKTQ